MRGNLPMVLAVSVTTVKEGISLQRVICLVEPRGEKTGSGSNHILLKNKLKKKVLILDTLLKKMLILDTLLNVFFIFDTILKGLGWNSPLKIHYESGKNISIH